MNLREVETETRYTNELYKKTFWFSAFRGRYYRIRRKFLYILTGFMFVMALTVSFWTDRFELIVYFRVSAILLGLWNLYLLLSLRKKLRKRRQQPDNVTLGVCFNETKFWLITIFEDDKGMIRTGEGKEYAVIKKVYETGDMFYLFTGLRQFFAIPKEDIIRGNAEELRALLQSRIDCSRYILCYVA